jgi:putative SOS response-associated peptidase YedK
MGNSSAWPGSGWKEGTCATLTREAEEDSAVIHGRMPLALPWEREREWLEERAETLAGLFGALREAEAGVW